MATRELTKAKVRKLCVQRCHERCVRCGWRAEGGKFLHLHRVFPGREGGRYTVRNCVMLCESCHDEWTWVWEPLLTWRRFNAWAREIPSPLLMYLWIRTAPGGFKLTQQLAEAVRTARGTEDDAFFAIRDLVVAA